MAKTDKYTVVRAFATPQMSYTPGNDYPEFMFHGKHRDFERAGFIIPKDGEPTRKLKTEASE